MAVNSNAESPKKGMNRDTSHFEMSNEEYVFALNANTHGANGDGKVVLQNEPSNIRCSGFKPGYKVIGHKYEINEEKVYFFLTNPTTGFSEVGYISVNQEEDLIITPTESQDSSGNISVILEQPLENQEQQFTCAYNTIINDDCGGTGSKCLNFSIFSPIKENNIHFHYGKIGTTMWFTDGDRNPPRYIKLYDLDYYTQNTDFCTDDVEGICLDCEKMRVFPLYSRPCLTPKVIQTGGSLKAGVYEVFVAPANELNEAIGNYSVATNPIAIFDFNNIIVEQPNLDYTTNLSFSVDINGFEDHFPFFTVAIVYRSGLDNSLNVFNFGKFPNTKTEVVVDTLDGKARMNLTTVLDQKAFIERSKGLATSNGYLYHYGLKQRRSINLQPVVNLMGSLSRWSTYQAKETLYKDGVNNSLYRGYMRDEVYPFAISFSFKGGQETNQFPFIARPPRPDEIYELGSPDFPADTETDSVLAYNPECGENNRNKVWQFKNTALETATCLVPAGTGDEQIIEQEETISCFVRDKETDELAVLTTIANSSIIIPTNTDIVTWINTNIQNIIDSTGDNGEDIRDILDSPEDYSGDCIPPFGDTCSEEIELVSEEMFVISVDTQTVQQVSKIYEDSDVCQINNSCNIYVKDGLGDNVEDATFQTNYMEASETVFSRNLVTNNSCSSAIIPTQYTNPQTDNSNHLQNKGELTTTTTLKTSKNAEVSKSYISITLTGSSGTANINIDGVNYLVTFTTSLAQTAINFVNTHSPALTLLGLTATAVGNTIQIVGNYQGTIQTPVSNVTGDLAGSYDNYHFTDKVHSNAIWYRIPFNGQDNVVFEIGPTTPDSCDDNSYNKLRATFFSSCANDVFIAGSGVIIENTDNNTSDNIITLNASDFGGTSSTAYIALDSALRVRVVASQVVNTLTPPCNCFPVFTRQPEYSFNVVYTNLKFGKKQTHKALCEYAVPVLNDSCVAVPYKKGLFSYVESSRTYPCNKELYDSSDLTIKPTDIPLEYRDEFENYYVDSIVGSNYVLSSETDFRDKPIRHFKFPDNNVAPFMSSENQQTGAFGQSVIYPIGFNISSEVVGAFLDIAVNNGLISAKERSEITHFNIYRGDRRVQKSVIAKGLLFDMYQYNETNGQQNETVYYSNYPLNSLGTDSFNNVPHRQNSFSNDFFTFHSPDTHFEKPTLPRELNVEGYQFGNAASYFDQVRNHPTYVVLSDRAYNLATVLAIAETAFEITLAGSDLLVSGAAGGVSAPVSAPLAVTLAAALVGTGLFKTGQYRYQWIQTLYGLGKPENFAYYQAAIGYYNTFKPNNIANQKLRGLTVKTYITDGRWEVPDEFNVGNQYNINNLDRESSVLLKTGQYPIIYRPDYSVYDNSNFTQASRHRYALQNKSGKITRNAASMYAALKEYQPAQYGDIDSVVWLNTNFCGDLSDTVDCNAVFGGDVFISRFSVRRKLPFFRTNAFGLAPLTPFKYSDYWNINPEDTTAEDTRFYLDYKINDYDSYSLASFVFPSDRSKYNLDFDNNFLTPFEPLSSFYVKPPAKFYLFSYGIPYFLVESEINCNYRQARREPHENFYPNVSDVLEWTQEANMSIRESNTFFYNNVYSNVQVLSNNSMLPQTYSREVFDKLADMSSTVIYSKQDVSEDNLFHPWLSYKPLDTYTFSKATGDLVSIIGIESLQLLVRFSNSYTLYGAIDQLRDRLTEDTANLGNGGIFAGRPLNSNTTTLGYAGTQHMSHLSNEFGHFWVDAKRGKVFQMAPGGQGISEISRSANDINSSLEKWFKEQLPFKILKYFPNVDVDNNYNGFGITLGWDDRLKRVFVTKKDYVPKQDMSYAEGVGFYTGEPTCSEGYELVNGVCTKIETVNKIQTGEALPVVPAGTFVHGMQTPKLYSAYTPDGAGLVDVGSPTGYTWESLTAPFWLGNGIVANRITTILGRWVTPSVDETWVGGTSLVKVTTSGIYHVILAADNIFRFSVDGVQILQSDYDVMGPQITTNPANYKAQTFRQVHIYPIELEAGCHLVTVEGYNEDIGSEAMFAAAILNNTANEIRNATSLDDLDFIYSTAQEDNLFTGNPEFACPEGFDPVGDDICDECQRTLTESPVFEAISLDDKEYFTDCSWTVAYNPILQGWISYYSFKPNYYAWYNRYFQTGINVSDDSTEIGLWSHYPFNSSYQVFYGKLYPFIIEFPVPTKGSHSQLRQIDFWLQVKKYYDQYNDVDVFGVGFNKAIIYNSHQNSGLLELVHQKNDNGSQLLEYPKYNTNSIEVLQTEIGGKWSINYLYDTIKSEKAGMPIFLWDCANVLSTLDDRLLNYMPTYKDYLRGDYQIVRLINDKESRFKFLFRFAVDTKNYYSQ